MSTVQAAAPAQRLRGRGTALAVLAAVLLAGVWFGGGVFRDLLFAGDAPRAITPRGSLAEFEQASVRLFERSAPSVAYIFTESRAAGLFGASGELRQGAGSGFVWDRAGHVVTNNHVIAGATRVAVRLDQGEPIGARVIGVAPEYDLAVLELERPPAGLRPLPIGTSSNLRIGQSVFAIGNPFGLSRTLTTGIVSALDRRLPTSAGREVSGVIQTDAPINPGNSGGPLLDSAGRLIGVTTAIISPSGNSAGIGFAVPVDVVNRVVPRLIADGVYPRPGIGIHAAGEELGARLGLAGVLVEHVIPGSPAARAGLVAIDRDAGRIGDLIVAVEGERVRSVAELALALDRVGIGARATLTVVRDGRERDVVVAVEDIS